MEIICCVQINVLNAPCASNTFNRIVPGLPFILEKITFIMAYVTTAALFQFLGILCGCIAVGLESWAFHSDVHWNSKVKEYSRDYRGPKNNISMKAGFICEKFEKNFDPSKDLRDKERKGEKLFFPTSVRNDLMEKDLKIGQGSEKAYLIINVLLTFTSFAHFVLCCVSRKIIYRTKYNAIIHGMAIGLLCLSAIMLLTSRYSIDSSYSRIALADLRCKKVMACIGENEEYPAYDFYVMRVLKDVREKIKPPPVKYLYYMCQQASIKSTAVIINLIHVGFCGCVLCSAMTVVIQYGDEEFVTDSLVDDNDFNTNHRLSVSYNAAREMNRHSIFTPYTPSLSQMSIHQTPSQTKVEPAKKSIPNIVISGPAKKSIPNIVISGPAY